MPIKDVAIAHFVHQGAQVPIVSQSSNKAFCIYTSLENIFSSLARKSMGYFC